MDNNETSIHEFEFNLIAEYFSMLDRQGPGSPEVTLKALSFVGGLDADSRIADLGCGSGGQTLTLAEHTPGKITGIDVFPRFIEKLNRNAKQRNLNDRLKGIVGSMDDLPFEKESLDLIWSEGAIYFMGFEAGLKYWYRFLKPGGYVAVTEATWFTPDRPDEINDFWNLEYPGIDTIPNKVAQMESAGFIPVASFILPENCWTEHFFAPQPPVQEAFLEKHRGDKAAESFVERMCYEAALYKKYSKYYGYTFYIGRKA